MHNLFLANLTATTQIQTPGLLQKSLHWLTPWFSPLYLFTVFSTQPPGDPFKACVKSCHSSAQHPLMASHLTPSGIQSPYNGLRALFTLLYNPVYLSSISYQTPRLVPRRGRAKISSSCFSNKVKYSYHRAFANTTLPDQNALSLDNGTICSFMSFTFA